MLENLPTLTLVFCQRLPHRPAYSDQRRYRFTYWIRVEWILHLAPWIGLLLRVCYKIKSPCPTWSSVLQRHRTFPHFVTFRTPHHQRKVAKNAHTKINGFMVLKYIYRKLPKCVGPSLSHPWLRSRAADCLEKSCVEQPESTCVQFSISINPGGPWRPQKEIGELYRRQKWSWII